MDHSYSDIRSKIIFFQPSDRQNFANALGQTCILDLRLRRMGCRKLRFFPGKFLNFGKSAGVKDLTNIMSECFAQC